MSNRANAADHWCITRGPVGDPAMCANLSPDGRHRCTFGHGHQIDYHCCYPWTWPVASGSPFVVPEGHQEATARRPTAAIGFAPRTRVMAAVGEKETTVSEDNRSRPRSDDVAKLIAAYYSKFGNNAGGNCHAVLDDGNLEDGSIRYCLAACEQEGDADGLALMRLFLLMRKTARGKAIAMANRRQGWGWT